MLSEVEREAGADGSRPDRIATGLGTSIARLLREERSARTVVYGATAGRGAGCVRLGTAGAQSGPVRRGVRVHAHTIGPGVDAGVFPPHGPGPAPEYLAVERVRCACRWTATDVELRQATASFYAGDCHHGFTNPATEPCVFYLAWT